MNFFEKELRKIVGNQSAFENAKYIGRACIAELDGGVKLKAEFITGIVADHYQTLKLTAINPADGVIDRQLLSFNDYFKKQSIGGIPTTPHIWVCGGEGQWYTEPTIAEKAAIGDAVQDYAELFEQQSGMEMNM